MRIDRARLIEIMNDLRKVYAKLDAFGIAAFDLSPEWWERHAVRDIGDLPHADTALRD